MKFKAFGNPTLPPRPLALRFTFCSLRFDPMHSKIALARIHPTVLLIMIVSSTTTFSAEKRSLAERLGYQSTDKLLIINGDDAGMCHAANQGTIQCLEQGLMRSSTVMVPYPWFPEIAAYAKEHPDKDFGIHLCHTSEWKKYRWGPVANKDLVPGLLDPEGYLWNDVPDVYSHATPEQALIEARAQIKHAVAAGVDVTHLDSHMGTLQLEPRDMETY